MRQPFVRMDVRGTIKGSTKEFFRLHGWKNLGRFLHGYYYLARLDQYVRILLRGFRVLDKYIPDSKKEFFRPLFAFMPDRYHGKVIPLDQARKIVTLDQDLAVPEEASKRVVPFEIANRITIRNPDSIVVMDCACRMEKKNPCKPINVCMIIGEPYATFVLEHAESMNPRRISQEEAVKILEECHKRGLVHNAYFKDAMGDQFYAICNCCRCCCGGIEVERVVRSIGFRRPIRELAPSGYLALVREEDCKGCGVCVEKCPFDAVSLKNDDAVVDPRACMGCGVCTRFCPEEAIELKQDPTRGLPLDLQALVLDRQARVSRDQPATSSTPD